MRLRIINASPAESEGASGNLCNGTDIKAKERILIADKFLKPAIYITATRPEGQLISSNITSKVNEHVRFNQTFRDLILQVKGI